MARDALHNDVKLALIKEGWTITNDPLSLEGWRLDVYNREFSQIGVLASIEDYQVQIIIFDPLTKEISSWKKS